MKIQRSRRRKRCGPATGTSLGRGVGVHRVVSSSPSSGSWLADSPAPPARAVVVQYIHWRGVEPRRKEEEEEGLGRPCALSPGWRKRGEGDDEFPPPSFRCLVRAPPLSPVSWRKTCWSVGDFFFTREENGQTMTVYSRPLFLVDRFWNFQGSSSRHERTASGP